MSKDAEYRLRAIECAEAAERTGDLHERLALLNMAQAWVKLADYAQSVPTAIEGKQPLRFRDGDGPIGDETEP